MTTLYSIFEKDKTPGCPGVFRLEAIARVPAALKGIAVFDCS